MILKITGAGMVIAASGSFGFQLAASHKQLERMLQQLIDVISYMICELEYRLTPLPALSRQAADECNGPLSEILLAFSAELEQQTETNVSNCMENALSQHRSLPPVITEIMVLLGRTMGKFDIQGQIRGLAAVKQHCEDKLARLSRNRENRLRGYKTLALCAGAALAILLI